jgi:hypothetical protein
MLNISSLIVMFVCFNLLRVDKDVSKGIDHGVRHCAPVEPEEDVLDVLHVHHLRVVVGVDEVGVVRKPADAEYQEHNQNHYDNLKNR